MTQTADTLALRSVIFSYLYKTVRNQCSHYPGFRIRVSMNITQFNHLVTHTCFSVYLFYLPVPEIADRPPIRVVIVRVSGLGTRLLRGCIA